MATDWLTATVGDVAVRVTKGTTPTTIGGRFVDHGINFVKVESITADGRLDAEKLAHIDAATNDMFTRSVLCADDVLFTIAGTIGRVALVPSSALPANTNQAVAIVRPDQNAVDPRFLYYVLRDRSRLQQANTRVVQSVQSNFSLAELRALEIPLPDIAQQRAIAHILGTLDDKIELNRRTNETLEAIARALFKSWFIDFDPVRAKSEGRDPGLPPHIADLFPDSFEDSELGEIPTGWEVAPISDIADVIDCSHAKKPIRRAYGWPLLQLANIRSDGLLDMSDTYLIDRTEYETWTARIEASPGDCVITNVGRVGAVAQVPVGVRAALGRNMTALRCKMSFPFPTLLLEALVSDAIRNEVALNTDTGTILDSLNVRSIPRLRLVLPAANVARGFEALARPLRARMELNLVESRSLGVLRDAFLPKLISGQIRSRGSERLTDAV